MPSIDLICLANSYKREGRCVAGLRVDGRGWVRAVSDYPHGQLEYRQMRLQDGSAPQLLDVIRVGFSNPQPLPHQPENCLIDGSPWQLIARPARNGIAEILARSVENHPLLFGNAARSVAETRFRQSPAHESLVLIRPSQIRWRNEFSRTGQRNKARVVFHLAGLDYDLPLTDPRWVNPTKQLAPGDHASAALGMGQDREILFTVGLSDPFDGQCYKLVAGVILLPPS